MQRVVRSTLVGLLTIAGLTACGDKVTVPAPQTTVPDGTIHAVLVSPSQLTLAVGGKAILAASVDAGPAATNRTVTWSSSDATVASVGTDGTVTGVKGGTVTITASSAQDPTVKGAAAVTVTGAIATGQPTISIASVNATNAFGQSVPANLAGVAGQIDVILNVDAGGQILKTVSVTIKSGTTSVTQTQTLSAATAPAFAAEGAASTITFSFNTAAFNATTGVPALLNSATATITASATTTTSTTGAASSTITFVLANADAVVVTNSFAAVANAEGITPATTTATDAGGLPWRTGSVTVSGVPVLYSGRTVSSVSLNLPGATGALQTVTAAPYTATWGANATSGSRVTGLTLVGAGFEANGTTPLPITPTVIALDNVGNDLNLIVANPGITGASFRLDNTAPEAPTSFVTAGRQAGWVNAAYTFGGTGGASFSAATGTTKYVSCGDGATVAATVAGAYACTAQLGVSNAAVSGTSGTNGLTTFTWYSIPAASYAAINANGTDANRGTSSNSACSTTGWTKITTGGDLAGTLNNLAYVVRGFETDKLGNARCTDLAAAGGNTINTFAFVNGKFGVDKIAPTAAYVETATDATAASSNAIWNLASVGTVPANFLVKIGLADDASQPSGFSSTPVTTMVERLYVDAGTLAPSSFNSANGCPTGLSSGVCSTASAAASVPGWYSAGAGAIADASGCVGCGYYVFFQTPIDNARNAATTLGANSAATTLAGACTGFTGCRQVLIDVQAPVLGGIAVPATIVGGTTVAFSTSATDNLDLGTYDYTVLYPQTIVGGVATAPIRSPATATNGQTVGTAFDNVLTTSASFALQVPTFIRNMESTTAADVPQNNPVLPSQITGRVYDAAGNGGVGAASVIQPILPVNIPQAGRVDFAAPQPSTAVMTAFKVSNAATNISNGPASVTAVNPTTVTLSVTASGTESPTFQYINPFTSVQFYYLDPVTSEYILIGSSAASTVTDNAGVTVRTFTWNLSWDPPAALPVGAVKVIGVGINAAGDALASQVNANITLTNP